ncbi:hypothetical protein [Tautonia plasticadhaerens]|uniref:Uncharacterized protein n=1 Tax=Tautonia plasticadhaerens TaxID=2527974 RepID=A0A518H9A8_9BACT|nr:hypothetical protein [Tautonia plasticadhaerens]QDV37432.1 hypothetical protein ElP_53710 [Tautonia plasticadhaerens]
MPTLYLDRTFELSPDGDTPTVVCEPRRSVSRGWCARITLDPVDPYGLWRRVYLESWTARQPERLVELRVFEGLGPGIYEANSTRTSKKSRSVYFRVGPAGDITILGTDGQQDVVIAQLNGMTAGELEAARASSPGPDGLPRLQGTPKQVAQALIYRGYVLDFVMKAGDPRLVDRVLAIRDASWFFAGINRTIDALRHELLGRGPEVPPRNTSLMDLRGLKGQNSSVS